MQEMEHAKRPLRPKECRYRLSQVNLSALHGTIGESRGVEVTGHSV